MKQILTDSTKFIMNHPLGAIGSSATGVVLTDTVPTSSYETILKILTLLISLIPTIKQIFQTRKKKNNEI